MMPPDPIVVDAANKQPIQLGEQLATDVVQYPIDWGAYLEGVDPNTPPTLTSASTTITPSDGAVVTDDTPSGSIAPISVSGLTAGVAYTITHQGTFSNAKVDSIRLGVRGVS